MVNKIVCLENVWVHYNGIPVLEGIDLSIDRHDFLGIIGPNGGGKTTLLKVILGLVRPSRGKVKVFGTTPEKGRKLVGYVPQHSHFDRNFPISVWEVVLMGRLGCAGLFRKYSDEDEKVATNALNIVGMLDLKDRQIGKLSEGQRQRVFIARALAAKPKLLLLDEPTASIDKPMEAELHELLHKLRREMAIVLVSHDVGVVSVYVDKIACLNRRLFYHGSSKISVEILEETYQCPIELIAHGIPHRVLKEHKRMVEP